jgi:HPt (histidine-containing phosphotransfer) domain-containing protein
MPEDQNQVSVQIERLQCISGGDMDCETELINLFTDDSRRLLDELDANIERRDTEQVEHTAHTLKGSSGNMGADNLSEQSCQLQKIAASADWDAIEKLRDTIRQEFVKVEKFLAGYLQKNE